MSFEDAIDRTHINGVMLSKSVREFVKYQKGKYCLDREKATAYIEFLTKLKNLQRTSNFKCDYCKTETQEDVWLIDIDDVSCHLSCLAKERLEGL